MKNAGEGRGGGCGGGEWSLEKVEEEDEMMRSLFGILKKSTEKEQGRADDPEHLRKSPPIET